MRHTIDKLVSWMGIVVAMVLLAGGCLLLLASNFVGDQVGQQLSDQKIVMPDEKAFGELPKEDVKALEPYAGSQMDTGSEAKAYADHFILAHLKKATGGETYSTLGSKVKAACGENREKADTKECIAANAQRDTAFKGSTLRGLLLNAYAFGTMGTIAWFASIGAFIAGAILLVLAALGMHHSKTATDESEGTSTAGVRR